MEDWAASGAFQSNGGISRASYFNRYGALSQSKPDAANQPPIPSAAAGDYIQRNAQLPNYVPFGRQYGANPFGKPKNQDSKRYFVVPL